MMNKSSLDFLEQLSCAFGPSGFEREVAQFVRDYAKDYVDDSSLDKMGSLLLWKKEKTKKKPVVMLAAHMDEIGFVVSYINDNGFLNFNALGYWYHQVLLGQRVTVRTLKGDLPGVIAAKPPHVMSTEERNKLITQDKMFIDIGCSNRKEAEAMGIRIGDPVAPEARFATMKKTVYEKDKKKGTISLAMGKAFDDRVGVFCLVEVLRRLAASKEPYPNTVVGACTVQEEVGLRGARTASSVIKPDVALVLETDVSGDAPGVPPEKANAKMGKGVALPTWDKTMIPNQPLKELVISTAKRNRIPYQLCSVSGGTDAGMIHITHAGCPTMILGVPTRHIHSHVSVLALNDVENVIKLTLAVLKRLDSRQVSRLTEF